MVKLHMVSQAGKLKEFNVSPMLVVKFHMSSFTDLIESFWSGEGIQTYFNLKGGFFVKNQLAFVVMGALVSLTMTACVSKPPSTGSPAIFQEKEDIKKSIPAIGVNSRVDAGSNLYSEYTEKTSQEYFVTLLSDSDGKMDFDVNPAVKAGTKSNLMKTASFGYKAMCPGIAAKASIPGSYVFCLVDRKNDGSFDAAMFPERLRYFPLTVPVPYKLTEKEVNNKINIPHLKREFIYQGVSKGVVKISYREFIGSMARPAFTQDVSYDLDNDGTAIVAFKGLRIKILKADSTGVDYQVLRMFD